MADRPMITVRVTPEDREALKRKAAEHDMPLEHYVRFVLLGKRTSMPPAKRGRPCRKVVETVASESV